MVRLGQPTPVSGFSGSQSGTSSDGTVDPKTSNARSLLDIDDPRSRLLSLYTLNGVPNSMAGTMQKTKTIRNQPFDASLKTTAGDFMVRRNETPNEILKSLFANDAHPLLKREEISYAILTNHFNVNNHATSRWSPEFQRDHDAEEDDYLNAEADNADINVKDLSETRLKAHMNRHMYERPSILEVAGSPIKDIPNVDLKIEQKNYLWSLPCKGSSYLWSDQYYEPSAPMFVDRRPREGRERLPNAGSVALQNRQ
jgi:hypothetical protein